MTGGPRVAAVGDLLGRRACAIVDEQLDQWSPHGTNECRRRLDIWCAEPPLFAWSTQIEILNVVGVHYAIPGNHDLDHGLAAFVTQVC